MQAIIDFISGIGDFFLSIGEFVISFVEDIVFLVQLTAKFVTSIPSYFFWLPREALSIIISLFAVVVVYKVLGRD